MKTLFNKNKLIKRRVAYFNKENSPESWQKIKEEDAKENIRASKKAMKQAKEQAELRGENYDLLKLQLIGNHSKKAQGEFFKTGELWCDYEKRERMDFVKRNGKQCKTLRKKVKDYLRDNLDLQIRKEEEVDKKLEKKLPHKKELLKIKEGKVRVELQSNGNLYFIKFRDGNCRYYEHPRKNNLINIDLDEVCEVIAVCGVCNKILEEKELETFSSNIRYSGIKNLESLPRDSLEDRIEKYRAMIIEKRIKPTKKNFIESLVGA